VGFERAIGFRADLDGAFGAMGPASVNDAETGSKSLLGMGALTRICSHNAALAGSIKRASPRLRSIVQLAYRMGGGHMLRNGCVPNVKRRREIAVAQSLRERPGEPCALDAVQSLPDGRGRDAKATGDLPCRNSRCKLQSNNFARLAHRSSLRWHRSLPRIAKGVT